jgi:hypothetical protein
MLEPNTGHGRFWDRRAPGQSNSLHWARRLASSGPPYSRNLRISVPMIQHVTREISPSQLEKCAVFHGIVRVGRLRDQRHEVESRRAHWGWPRAYVRDPAGNPVAVVASVPGDEQPE